MQTSTQTAQALAACAKNIKLFWFHASSLRKHANNTLHCQAICANTLFAQIACTCRGRIRTIIFHEFCLFFLCYLSITRSESWTWLMAAVLKMLYQPQRTLIRSSFQTTRSFPRTSQELWIQFLSCDMTCMKSVFVWYKHFDDIHSNIGDIKEFVY